jgi:hypothetical protein
VLSRRVSQQLTGRPTSTTANFLPASNKLRQDLKKKPCRRVTGPGKAARFSCQVTSSGRSGCAINSCRRATRSGWDKYTDNPCRRVTSSGWVICFSYGPCQVWSHLQHRDLWSSLLKAGPGAPVGVVRTRVPLTLRTWAMTVYYSTEEELIFPASLTSSIKETDLRHRQAGLPGCKPSQAASLAGSHARRQALPGHKSCRRNWLYTTSKYGGGKLKIFPLLVVPSCTATYISTA